MAMNNDMDNDKVPPFDGGAYRLAEEQFVEICKGLNIRKMIRETETDEELVRGASAVTLLMFKEFPNGLTQEEVFVLVNSSPYIQMTDEEFQVEVNEARSVRMN